MSDLQAEADLAPAPQDSVQQWLALLVAAPEQAVDELLRGAVWLGTYASLDPPQALPQFLPVELTDTFDLGLQTWLAKQLRHTALPPNVTAKQYAKALTDAFALAQTLGLSLTQRWCRDRANALWRWLGSQPSFASREPRAPFLRALALDQPNRDLLGFWVGLCQQADARWAPLALFGLRRMPMDDEGTASPGLPMPLVSALIDYGLTLARRGDAFKKQWLNELDLLTAVYPMSTKPWAERFREALAPRDQAAVRPLRHWLDERFRAANEAAPTTAAKRLLMPPHWDNEIRPLLDRYDAQTHPVVPQLRAQMDRHLHYAKAAGDSHFLVVSNCRLANFLLQAPAGATVGVRDAAWATDLAQIAVQWAPSNHRGWSVLARSLDAKGDWPQAQSVFWYARRRFPYNPQGHNQLGHALMARGLFDQGEAVYRAAIRRFPDNAVCWADLGNTLKVAGRLDEALAVYQEARQRFHNDPAICCALADVLIDLGRLDDARDALAWAEQVVPDDAKSQRVLENLRRRLHGSSQGRPLHKRRMASRPLSSQAGDWGALERAAGTDLRGMETIGQATLWRQRAQADDLALAHAALAVAGGQLAQGQDDPRWLAEQGLWLATQEGWVQGRQFFDQIVNTHPGEGVLAALRLDAHVRAGESVDWQSLRGRFEELAPLIRVRQGAEAGRPAELEATVRHVTGSDDQVDWDDISDEVLQSLRVYDTAADPNLAELAQQDFLAARQLTVF